VRQRRWQPPADHSSYHWLSDSPEGMTIDMTSRSVMSSNCRPAGESQGSTVPP
jgi:hypothetical protein